MKSFFRTNRFFTMYRFSQTSCFLFILLLGTVQAQDDELTIKDIPVSTIKEMVSDPDGVYFYPKIRKKFEADETLLDIDYLMLYYGYVFQDNYNPYRHFALEDSLGGLTSAQKGNEALRLANLILEENPVSIIANIEKAYALHGMGKEEEAKKYLERYRLLMEALESSGEGSSYDKPIVIINPKDAQAILLKYRLTELSKSINGQNNKYYDVYLVRNKEGKQYPIYFDITIPRTIGMAKFKKDLE